MRTLDANTLAAVGADVTRPVYLVRLGFNVITRLTTGETVNWSAEGGTFTAASFEVAPGPEISIFNENKAFGVTVLTDGTAGREMRIWQAYRASGATSSLPGHTEPELLFVGLMGPAVIGAKVVITGKRIETQYTPRQYVAPPLFNHLPKAGTVIEMPGQKVVLE